MLVLSKKYLKKCLKHAPEFNAQLEKKKGAHRFGKLDQTFASKKYIFLVCFPSQVAHLYLNKLQNTSLPLIKKKKRRRSFLC